MTLPEPAPAAALERLPYYPWLVVATTCVGASIGQLDASIVQLAMPALELAFDAPLHEVSWVAVGYVLAFAGILPVFSRLAEIAGRKSMYLGGFALFGLASALCGLAPSLPWLIAFRVLQGIGGAMLGANAIVIQVAAAGPQRKGRAMGVYAAAQAVGISGGPALGGLLLDALGWRWIFWVNVPLALAAVAIGWLVVPRTATAESGSGFDMPGALLLIPGLAALLLALTQLHAWGLATAPTLGCAAAALALLGAFVRRELRAESPLLDVRLFGSPAFSGGCVAVVLSYAMLYAMFFVMSFALVRGLHDTPLAAGLRLAIIPVALALVAPFSGGASEAHPRLMAVTGMGLCVAALLGLAAVIAGSAAAMLGVMIALAAFGAGMGTFIAPNNTATMSAAPPARSGQAGGLLNLLRVFGTGFGVAAASTMLSWRLAASGGPVGRTAGVPEAVLLAAVRDVLALVAVFAALAGAVSLLRGRGRAGAGGGNVNPATSPPR